MSANSLAMPAKIPAAAHAPISTMIFQIAAPAASLAILKTARSAKTANAKPCADRPKRSAAMHAPTSSQTKQIVAFADMLAKRAKNAMMAHAARTAAAFWTAATAALTRRQMISIAAPQTPARMTLLAKNAPKASAAKRDNAHVQIPAQSNASSMVSRYARIRILITHIADVRPMALA